MTSAEGFCDEMASRRVVTRLHKQATPHHLLPLSAEQMCEALGLTITDITRRYQLGASERTENGIRILHFIDGSTATRTRNGRWRT